MLFLRHTTKRKVQAQPWLSFWRYRQTPISIQTRKAHTLWHEHSLTYIWWIYSSKLAIFQNSSSKKQTLLFPICLVKLLFHFTFFGLSRCKNTIFLATNNLQLEFHRNYVNIRNPLVWADFPCHEEGNITPIILVQKYVLSTFHCHVRYDLSIIFCFHPHRSKTHITKLLQIPNYQLHTELFP